MWKLFRDKKKPESAQGPDLQQHAGLSACMNELLEKEKKLCRYKLETRRLLQVWNDHFLEEFPFPKVDKETFSDYADFIRFVAQSLKKLAEKREKEKEWKRGLWG